MTVRSPYAEGLRAFESGLLDEAQIRFTEAALDPAVAPAALSKRGVCKVLRGDRDGARADFEIALERNPRCAQALVNLGNLAQEAGDDDEARRRYLAAIAAEPEYPPAHHNLGVLYRKMGRMDESVRELRHAGRLEARPRALMERFKAFFRRA
jgi:tetratricopeptide (TPR) repeat protein